MFLGNDREGSRLVGWLLVGCWFVVGWLMYTLCGGIMYLSEQARELTTPPRFLSLCPPSASCNIVGIHIVAALSLLCPTTRGRRERCTSTHQLVMFVLQDHEALVIFRAGFFYPDEIDRHGRILSKVSVRSRYLPCAEVGSLEEDRLVCIDLITGKLI